jgi:hypothetical protein
MAEEPDQNPDQNSDEKRDLRKPTERPVSPRHPNDDAMPPYAPGGVPEPTGDTQEPAGKIEEREVPPSGFPPKRDP